MNSKITKSKWHHSIIISSISVVYGLNIMAAGSLIIAPTDASATQKNASAIHPKILSSELSTAKQYNESGVKFDIGTLKTLGYGEDIAEFFKHGSQFLPGSHDVTLVVNGSAHYSATIKVGEQGQLCATPALQRILKFREVAVRPGCTDLALVYPGIKITPHPHNATVDILVAENTFDPQLRGDELTYGGFALLSNYRIYGLQMTGFNRQHFYQGQFESGINWRNWVLRNNSSFSAGKNSSQYQLNETTLSRSISPWQAQLEMGQLSTHGSLFGGTPLNGAQLYSDPALQNSQRLVVPITGIAQTSATVEVMQNGRLLYRTLIPAGPFELDRVNGIVSGQPLQVSLIQEDGQRQQFSVVTSNQLTDKVMIEPTYQIAAGQYRRRSGNNLIATPVIINMEGSLRYQQTHYLAGLQYSDRYQSVGTQLSRQWGEDLQIGSSLNSQYARNSNQQGQQWSVSTSAPLGPLSLGISSLYRTRDYPTLDETLQDLALSSPISDDERDPLWWPDRKTKVTNSASFSFRNTDWGRLSYSLGHTLYYGDKPDAFLHTVSYGRNIQNLSLSISYQGGNDRDNRVFVNASIPFGRNASLSGQMQRYQAETTLTTTFNHRPSNLFGYSVGASRSHDTHRVNGSVNVTTAYSQLAGSGSWSDNHNRSMMFSSSGALAYSNGLIATSPVALGDTFGVLHIPGQPGVQVSTLGGGTTLTNHFGIAAIPTLPVNRKTTVQLNTRNVPLNVRLETTSFDVAVARGTVIARDVAATVMTQLLLEVTLANHRPAPSGSSVIDENGQLITVVMGNGNVLLDNELIGQPIRLRMPNQTECLVNYPVPTHFDPNLLYEEVKATCQ